MDPVRFRLFPGVERNGFEKVQVLGIVLHGRRFVFRAKLVSKRRKTYYKIDAGIDFPDIFIISYPVALQC